MKKWEYMVQRLPCDQPDIEQGLDKLGKDGWEMTGCGSTGTNFDTSQVLLLFFKREIPEPQTEPRQATTGEVMEYIHGAGDIVHKSPASATSVGNTIIEEVERDLSEPPAIDGVFNSRPTGLPEELQDDR